MQTFPSPAYLVLLAPFGLNAHLTGHSIPDSDARSTKILNEWKRFFPVEGKQAREKISKLNDQSNSKGDALPMIVEVTLGEVKMLYPSSLVLVSCGTTKCKFRSEMLKSVTLLCDKSKAFQITFFYLTIYFEPCNEKY